ncbi:hypothetical protein Tco_1317080 [Tanacetum coccineum]
MICVCVCCYAMAVSFPDTKDPRLMFPLRYRKRSGLTASRCFFEWALDEYLAHMHTAIRGQGLIGCELEVAQYTLMTDEGLVVHMLIEKKYPLKMEILVQMLKLKLESEEESTMALELIRFIKKILADLESKE